MAPINIESPVFYLYNVAAPGINSLFSRHIFPQGSNEIIGILYKISLCLNLYNLFFEKYVSEIFTTILEKTGSYIGFSQNFVMLVSNVQYSHVNCCLTIAPNVIVL